ncbi:hypothetical protein ACWGI8_20165 [Streptomyces sp. NPDC054841]
MSEIAGTPSGTRPIPVAAPETVQESYAFACMRCGRSWEQTYDIEHHTDGRGQPFFMYRVQGQLVPSPLTHLTCLNCGGQKVRIMRGGQVSSLAESLRRQHITPPNYATAGPVPASETRASETGATEPQTTEPQTTEPRPDAGHEAARHRRLGEVLRGLHRRK